MIVKRSRNIVSNRRVKYIIKITHILMLFVSFEMYTFSYGDAKWTIKQHINTKKHINQITQSGDQKRMCVSPLLCICAKLVN